MIGAKKVNSGVWILVIILALLTVSTVALLYSVTGSYTIGETNVVDLVPDHGGNGDAPTLSPLPGDASGEQWKVEKDIDLFKAVYTNEKGEVIAESEDGTPIIAPGTSHTYQFSLKNPGHLSMDFCMTLDGLFSMLDSELPFEVRLKGNGSWLIGDESTWVSPSELASLEIRDTVGAGRYLNYTLEWRWPFETASDPLLGDLNDTMLGDKGSLDGLNFSLEINTVATVTEGAVITSSTGWVVLTELIPEPVLYVILALVILAILAGAIGLLVFKGEF